MGLLLGLPLISNLSQKAVTPFAIGRGFDTLRRTAIDYAQDSPPLRGFRQDYFHGVGGGTEDIAYLGDFTDAAQDIDGVARAKGDDKGMACAHGLRVSGGDAFELQVVTVY